MSHDAIGDFLAIIRNGIMASKRFIEADFSHLRYGIAQVLLNEGFVKDVLIDESDSVKKRIKIVLKYVDGESVIHEITRLSKPSRRVYKNSKNIRPVIGGLGISILTTNKGIITHQQAKNLSVGGEIICTVW